MSVRLWRVELEGRDYVAAETRREGQGTRATKAKAPGLLYAASTQSLAILEGAVMLPLPSEVRRCIVSIDVPDDVWHSRDRLVGAMGVAARSVARVALRRQLRCWASAGQTAVMEIRSDLAPDESLAVINVQHPDATRIARERRSGLRYP